MPRPPPGRETRNATDDPRTSAIRLATSAIISEFASPSVAGHEQRVAGARSCRARGSSRSPSSSPRRSEAMTSETSGAIRKTTPRPSRAAPAGAAAGVAGCRRTVRSTGPGERRTRAARASSATMTSTWSTDSAAARGEVELLGGEQVDLGLDVGVAQPAHREHDAERGRAEQEDDAGRRDDARAAAPAASPCGTPASGWRRAPPRPPRGAGRSPPRTRRPCAPPR